MKLTDSQKHILNLIARDKKEDGWASVSEMLFKILSDDMPKSLAVFEKMEVGGRVRLTEEGQGIIDAMVWLY